MYQSARAEETCVWVQSFLEKFVKMRWKKILSVKYSLLAVDILFALTGVVILSVGISVLLFYKEYESLLSPKYFDLPSFLIATAVIIFVVSPLGIYGAISENFYVIVGYGALLLVILIFEMSFGIAGYSLRDSTTADVRRALQLNMLQYGSRIEITVMWDDLQRDFECCGVNGPSDWWNAFGGVPVSCCHADYGQISPMECDQGNAHTASCSSLLGAMIGHQALVMGICGVVLCCFQVVLTAATGWIAWRSRYEEAELES